MKKNRRFQHDLRLAIQMWGDLKKTLRDSLLGLLKRHCLSVAAGDLLLIDGRWYVTHSGLLMPPASAHPKTDSCEKLDVIRPLLLEGKMPNLKFVAETVRNLP